MNARKVNAELPASEAEILRDLRERGETRQLHGRVLALRNQSWPLRAIADVIGVSRMSVQIWGRDAVEDPELVELAGTLDVPPLPDNARGSRVTGRKMKVDVPPKDRDRLKELAVSARQVRRWTPPNAPERVASHELDRRVLTYLNRGVTAMDIARAAGVTRRAIAARLERIERDNQRAAAIREKVSA